jgi:hypothetical protein
LKFELLSDNPHVMLSAKHRRITLDKYERISKAADAIRDALAHEKSLRGKPEHASAVQDFQTAVREFEEAVAEFEGSFNA